MTDNDKHRGRAPGDEPLFAPAALEVLRVAVAELSWLLDRGYSQRAALTLVGDHHELRARQRLAVLRCACGEAERVSRQARRLTLGELRGREVAVDGFNCLITVEAALGGGLLLRGRDGVLRDLASVHGSYRGVAETEPAIRAMGAVLASAAPAVVRIFLDRPVSNSGRVRQLMEVVAAQAGWPWQVRLADNPDREVLASTGWVAASSDGAILDRCGPWVALSEAIVAAHAPAAWIVDLGGLDPPGALIDRRISDGGG